MGNCAYDCVKILHKVSRLAWFLEKHGEGDAQATNHQECRQAMQELHKELDVYVTKFRSLVCKHD